MSVRVPLWGAAGRFAKIDPEATNGATIGVNVRNADGSLFDPASYVAQAIAAAAPSVPIPDYTDAMADVRVQAGIDAHEDEEDPHPQYLLTADVVAAVFNRIDGNGDIRIDGNGDLRISS